MTANTEVKKTAQVLNVPLQTKNFTWLVVLAIAVILTMISVTLLTITRQREATASALPAISAMDARRQGLAELNAAQSGLVSQRGNEAWAARYQGLADLNAQSGLISQRGIDAWTARYQGLADLHAAENQLASLHPVNTSSAR